MKYKLVGIAALVFCGILLYYFIFGSIPREIESLESQRESLSRIEYQGEQRIVRDALHDLSRRFGNYSSLIDSLTLNRLTSEQLSSDWALYSDIVTSEKLRGQVVLCDEIDKKIDDARGARGPLGIIVGFFGFFGLILLFAKD